MSDKKSTTWKFQNIISFCGLLVSLGSLAVAAIALVLNHDNTVVIRDLRNEFDELTANKIKTNNLEVNSSTTTDDAYFSGKIFTGNTTFSEDLGSPTFDRNSNLTAAPAAGSSNMIPFGEFNGQPFAYAYAQNNGAAGGMKNGAVVMTTTTRPDQNNNTDLGTPDVSWRSLYLSSTAYISNIQAINSAADMTTFQLGSTVNKSCLILGDIDGNGLTYCTVLKGTLTCRIEPCNP